MTLLISGTTKNKWDSIIPLDLLWGQYKRIIKPNGAIVLFAQSPFDKVLACSNLDMFKYEWIWEKPCATGFLNSKFAPLKAHENLLVFSKAAACYVKDASKAMTFYPQYTDGKPYISKQGHKSSNYDEKWQRPTVTTNKGTRNPRDVIRFKSEKGLHPTQKPVPLLEYMIKTYTDVGDLVLDNTMGSGSCGVACVRTNRNFIGIELDKKCFGISMDRIGHSLIM